MKPLAPNTMIQNRYLVVQLIGKGGMGEVYLAVDQRLGSAVALKRTYFSDDSALGTAFEREARILARLRHPVLPKVIDHFAENGDQFLVMEHISGDDLSKRLENADKPFPLKWVMFWADQLLDALAYLHSHEPPIIHRDIKPQNLKLTDENHIVLLDFGLSKDFDSSAALNSASVAGYSPHFAAMEQIRGTGTDGRSDLYSLSATLYQLMSNTVPVDALSRADALLGGNEDPIVPISEINPEVPEAVSNVILKGIGLRQEERFSTASEMQRSLRRAYNQGKADVTPVKEPAAVDAGKPAPVKVTEAKQDPAVTNNVAAGQRVGTAETAAEVKQADIRTEVLSRSELPVPDAASNIEAPAARPVNGRANAAAAGADRGPHASIPTVARSKPAAEKTKKAGSKTGLVLGVIGLLAFVAVAAGGGWYAYSNYYAVSAPRPTPMTLPSLPPAGPEPVIASESNVSSGTNSELTGANSEVNSNSSSNPGNASRPASGKNQPARQKAPAPKATAKPKGDERTVILQ